ncbi:MAG TPA: serine/threonine-protein kinase, partial [Polyangia bacterium]
MSDGVPFGNYRLQRRLARGGMAEVFLARLIGVEGFERRVAIKRILPHLSESEEFRGMFLDEARLAAQLTHPNIVHIYDFGKADDYYFIAMEYVDGVDIGRLIRRAKERPMPFELAARIFADVCAGLHFAHNAVDPIGRKLEVVHRDITPQNVLVSYDGVVKVVDFGIAKAQFAAGRTRPGVVKGKYAYMSPEQVEGKSLDGRSDVFSAGICLYEMLTGVPLFRRDDVTASMREIRDGKPIHPEKHRKDVPEELVKIMRRALQTSRDNRYASASAMQTDLEKFLKSATALATSRELGEYIRRELPPTPEEAAPSSTSAQPAGTQRQPQKQRTEVQL